MATPAIPQTYNEPTVLWRMRHPSDGEAHALIIPAKPYATALWCIDGVRQDGGDFREWRLAILWLNAVCRRLRAEGWHPAEDLDAG